MLHLGELLFDPTDAGLLFTAAHRARLVAPLHVGGPVFTVDGVARDGFAFRGVTKEADLPRGGREAAILYASPGDPELGLEVVLRAYPDSSVVRFKYTLSASEKTALTKIGGHDRIGYLTLWNEPSASLTEIQLSQFDPVAHSYLPGRTVRQADEIYDGLCLPGPIVACHSEAGTVLLAYEHGADYPDSFLEFACAGETAARTLTLRARKGNYHDGQAFGPGRPFETVWFELGLSPLPLVDFLPVYRRFLLEEISDEQASRRPYIFYNTWNHQERNRYFRGRPFLESMNRERMAAEIEAAHRIGIDVFVIDTGWYGKTGDWRVDRDRFPDGLLEIKRLLDDRGMKLGLWFNPTVVALTSEIFSRHPEFELTKGGKPAWRGPVWETEESTAMCLASGYADYYIEDMVRLHGELGVSYFKWDGVGQFGCDSPLHGHGGPANTAAERADCYAYEMGRSMIRIAWEITRRCPGSIVDFDITEGGRFVGLGFLAAGKYFLVNNGPYFSDFDIPRSVKIEPDTINVLFHPGPARPRICRTGARFDAVVPSALFLTHYLPDPPRLSQENSLAALVLGGNGLWGDLPGLDRDAVAFWAEHLAVYKRVAGAATRAYPRVRGFAGASPEIHEKIEPGAAAGLVAFFTVAPGFYEHLTQPLNLKKLAEIRGADAWEARPDGRLLLRVELGRNGARTVFVIGED